MKSFKLNNTKFLALMGLLCISSVAAVNEEETLAKKFCDEVNTDYAKVLEEIYTKIGNGLTLTENTVTVDKDISIKSGKPQGFQIGSNHDPIAINLKDLALLYKCGMKSKSTGDSWIPFRNVKSTVVGAVMGGAIIGIIGVGYYMISGNDSHELSV